MKAQARFVGLDDAPFRKGDPTVPVVAVVTRGASYVEGVLSGRVAVDGQDATDALVRLLGPSRFRPMVRALFLNGIFVGGFNLVDPEVLNEAFGVPVVAVVRSKPRMDKVEHAMRAHLDEGERRWRRARELEPAPLPGLGVWATVRGATMDEAADLVRLTLVRGRLPEPLRLAHVVASGFVRGESRGRA